MLSYLAGGSTQISQEILIRQFIQNIHFWQHWKKLPPHFIYEDNALLKASIVSYGFEDMLLNM